MSSTTFTLPAAEGEVSRLARGYYWHSPMDKQLASTQGQYIPEPYIDISPISGAGSTISTVNDYALWIQAWLNAAHIGGSTNTSSPITHNMFQDLLTARTIISESLSSEKSHDLDFITPPNYALGWVTTKYMGEPIVWHNGGLTGFGTEAYMLPERSYGIITMANTQDTSNVAGAIIASRLIAAKLNITTLHETVSSTLRKSLMLTTNTNLRYSGVKVRRHRSSSKLPTASSSTKVHPLPGSVADFAGQYAHPAYGTIDLNIAIAQHDPSESILEGLFYPRTWPMKIRLSHITGTTFAVKTLFPHGLGNITSGEGIFWEDATDDDDRAFFELGLNGVVETVGIELDGSMVEMAEEKGVKHWKEGMIWFEKV